MLELAAIAATFGPIDTKLVDLLRNAAQRFAKRDLPKWLTQVAAFVIGELLSFSSNVSLPVVRGLSGFGVHVVMGLLIGAAGSGWHEVFDFISSTAKARRGASPTAG
jgi:hypothetical protein